MTQQTKSLKKEFAQLLDRRSELIEPRAEIQIADRLRAGETTEAAARNHQLEQAEAIQREIELEAVEERLEELWSDLCERLKSKRQKAISAAEHRLENARLRWQSGDGAKLFADEQIRAKLFIFSSAAGAGLEAINEAVRIPLCAQDDFKWEVFRAVRPGRHDLAKLAPRERPLIERAASGQGVEDLPRFLENC